MRRGVLALVCATAIAGTAGATPRADLLVRPGKAVGNIQLGMTEAALRLAMGKPAYVVPREGSFGRARVEYQYGPTADWSVLLAGPRGKLRVESVLTQLPGQRLANGFGVGSREAAIRKAYGRKLVCERWPTTTFNGRVYLRAGDTRTCVLPGPAGAVTVFVSRVGRFGYGHPEDIPKARVQEVGVRMGSR